MEKSTGRRRISRFLHWIGEGSSRATVAALVLLVAVKFSANWEVTFSTVAAAITLVMVFVIQHTQSRQQVATQLKLDELIRSTPRADDLLIHVESADDEELLAMDQEGIDQHSAIRDSDDENEDSEDGSATPSP